MQFVGRNSLQRDLIEFDYSQIPEERRPDFGKHWICVHCTKEAADRYGIIGPHSHGYDESCMLNAVQIEHNEYSIPKT
jgi:hypothetical protein